MGSASTTEWTIDSFCNGQVKDDWSFLPLSSRELLEGLGLSSVHPFCIGQTFAQFVPPQGPMQSSDGIVETIVTLIINAVPSLWAMGELWLRLFAGVLGPLGILLLMRYCCWQKTELGEEKKKRYSHQRYISVICLLTVASCVVLLTDTLYVLSYGPLYGGCLLTIATAITWCASSGLKKTRYAIGGLLVLCLYLSFAEGRWAFGGAAEECRLNEGLYVSPTNPLAEKIKNHWSFEYTNPTRWMPTGDSRTGIPFLINKVNPVEYSRVWNQVADGEVVALDWAFPENGFDAKKPVYFILHGLNGGSGEEYIQDFVQHAKSQNATAVVMVARGLMDLPVEGWSLFHGARWTDPHESALIVKKVLPNTKLIGVGYSMGAIIMSNWVTRAGNDIALDGAMAVSGGLDLRFQTYNFRAQRLWQPMLTQTLREDFVFGKWGERVRARLSKEVWRRFNRATHISGVDETFIVHYNGFDDLQHYYREMSALGDVEDYSTDIPSRCRIHNVSIPFAVVHALDDPLISFRTVTANEGPMHPERLTKTGNGNLMILLTKGGGHVGWPVGWFPHDWKYMSALVTNYGDALVQAEMEMGVSSI